MMMGCCPTATLSGEHQFSGQNKQIREGKKKEKEKIKKKKKKTECVDPDRCWSPLYVAGLCRL
jgi:hypothetical protein